VLRTWRAEVLISSKFGQPSFDMGYGRLGRKGGRRYIRHAVDESLRRLGSDWIDLYQLHCPDPAVPVEETAGALAELAEAGKIRHYGHSNFSGWPVCDAWHAAHSAGLPQFVTTQARYSLLDRQADTEILPAYERFGVSMLAYAPLAKGLLTGALANARDLGESSRMATSPEMVTTTRVAKVNELRVLCAERGLSLTGVAIAAVLAQPAIASCVLGASRTEQTQDAAAAVTVELTPSDLEQIDAIVPPRTFTLWTAPAQTPVGRRIR
jgi:aryl-alcohol dehydrogenase-like predicted oxidoreductase